MVTDMTRSGCVPCGGRRQNVTPRPSPGHGVTPEKFRIGCKDRSLAEHPAEIAERNNAILQRVGIDTNDAPYYHDPRLHAPSRDDVVRTKVQDHAAVVQHGLGRDAFVDQANQLAYLVRPFHAALPQGAIIPRIAQFGSGFAPLYYPPIRQCIVSGKWLMRCPMQAAGPVSAGPATDSFIARNPSDTENSHPSCPGSLCMRKPPWHIGRRCGTIRWPRSAAFGTSTGGVRPCDTRVALAGSGDTRTRHGLRTLWLQESLMNINFRRCRHAGQCLAPTRHIRCYRADVTQLSPYPYTTLSGNEISG